MSFLLITADVFVMVVLPLHSVETWLADSTESSHKLISSCSSIRGVTDLQPVLAQADRSTHPHSRCADLAFSAYLLVDKCYRLPMEAKLPVMFNHSTKLCPALVD